MGVAPALLFGVLGLVGFCRGADAAPQRDVTGVMKSQTARARVVLLEGGAVRQVLLRTATGELSLPLQETAEPPAEVRKLISAQAHLTESLRFHLGELGRGRTWVTAERADAGKPALRSVAARGCSKGVALLYREPWPWPAEARSGARLAARIDILPRQTAAREEMEIELGVEQEGKYRVARGRHRDAAAFRRQLIASLRGHSVRVIDSASPTTFFVVLHGGEGLVHVRSVRSADLDVELGILDVASLPARADPCDRVLMCFDGPHRATETLRLVRAGVEEDIVLEVAGTSPSVEEHCGLWREAVRRRGGLAVTQHGDWLEIAVEGGGEFLEARLQGGLGMPGLFLLARGASGELLRQLSAGRAPLATERERARAKNLEVAAAWRVWSHRLEQPVRGELSFVVRNHRRGVPGALLRSFASAEDLLMNLAEGTKSFHPVLDRKRGELSFDLAGAGVGLRLSVPPPFRAEVRLRNSEQR